MCAAIALLKLCTWLYNYDLQIEDGYYIDQFLEELCPLRDFTVFRTFCLSPYRYSFDIWSIALPIKFEFGFDPLIFLEVMALGLRKKSRIISFTHYFFSYSFDIWYIGLPYLDTDQVLSLVLIH
jgi:hypothetical protein